ncbi:MAG: RNA polymerase sporulation sigma factor SigK [Lachnospiraceae bacterium]|nr:RNA polymerase sporulation sigma factor SigK [Lachnospiraceae bacterium]
MKTFQQPLTSDEEVFYIRLMQEEANGEKGLEARNILIERNLRLVAHVAKKYQGCDESMEDLISVGTIGLMKAIATFNPGKGNRLATYAARCIENELLMMFRAKKKTSKEISLYEPIGTDSEGNEISLLDIVEGEQVDVVEEMCRNERLEKLEQLVKTSLTPREQEIIYMRYGLLNEREMTQREVGIALGISRSYVSRIEKKALKKLRESFDHTK